MTFEEALRKLDLSDGASAEEAKRAYHKLLKVNKPEVDRDAFISLREAYECVRTTLAIRAHLAASSESARGPAEAGPPAEPAAHASPVPQPPMAEPRTATPSAPLVTASPLPASSAPAPTAASPEEPAPPAEGDRFSELLEQRDYAAVSAMLCKSFDRLADQPGVVPPVIVTLQTMLACHATNQVAAAQALESRFALWLERSGLETSLDAPPIAMWVIARELTALAPTVPFDVRGPIAEAVLEGDLGKVKFRLATLSVERPSAAATLFEQMKKKAPTLASALGEAFSVPRPPPATKRTSSSSWGPHWAVIVAVSALLRIFSSNARDCSSPSPTTAYLNVGERAPVTRVEPAKKISPQQDLRQELWSVLQLSDGAAETAKRCNLPHLAEQAMDVGAQVRSGNCSMAQASMWIVYNTSSTLSDSDRECVRGSVEQLERNLRLICPPDGPDSGRGKSR